MNSTTHALLDISDPTTVALISDIVRTAVADALPKGEDRDTIANVSVEDSEEVAMLRGEIGRLSSMINSHMEGVSGATRAGMDVLGERARQRRMEGYDDAHDDAHDDFDLTSAAIAYLMNARLRGTTGHSYADAPPHDWPWSARDWKPKGVRQELVVAAALIIAEIEKIDRSSVYS